MSNLQASAVLAAVGAATIQNSSSSLSYLSRFKIVDSNNEILSDWSVPNLSVQDSVSSIITGYTPIYSISSVESGGVGLNIKWTVPEILDKQKFDIYFAWSYDNGSTYTDFVYAETVTSNNYYIEIPTVSTVKAQKVKLAVQLPTNKKIVNTNALLFQTPGVTTLPYLDAGTI
jgi:hypothetical protein